MRHTLKRKEDSSHIAQVTRRSVLKGIAAAALTPPLDLRQARELENEYGVEAFSSQSDRAAVSDPLLFPGDRNILDEEHFGVINGLVTAGVNYRHVSSLSGLFSPPFASSDFMLELRLFGEKVRAETYEWHPAAVSQGGHLSGIAVTTTVCLADRARGGIIGITLRNVTSEKKQVPLQISFTGSLDYVKVWEFGRPDSTKKPTTAAVCRTGVFRTNDSGAIAVATSFEHIGWQHWSSSFTGTILLEPQQAANGYLVLAIGRKSEADAVCKHLLANCPGSLADARRADRRNVDELFTKLPRLDASDSGLVAYYNRSLAGFLINRWTLPDFVLNPYYGSGSMKAGCLSFILVIPGYIAEIWPLYDSDATKSHIRQFLRMGIHHPPQDRAHDLDHSPFGFCPIDQIDIYTHWLPHWYPHNTEKIINLIYNYVQATGDTNFLHESILDRSVLDWVRYHAEFADDLTKPAALVNYGDCNPLELEDKTSREYDPELYDYVMPDLNGRRFQSYRLSAKLGRLAGQNWGYMVRRAERIKILLKETLWSPKDRWFFFIDRTGQKRLRYTNQLYELFSSEVLDKEEQEGLLSHLNDSEFLSPYGLHSMSKQDPAYNQADIDAGGGGDMHFLTPRIIQSLYLAGYTAQAEEILKRTLWWGERVPYWGDSFVANQVEYRKDSPLQGGLGAGAGAQCIIFGMFGVKLAMDGGIIVNPKLPEWCPNASLIGITLRGRVLDVAASQDDFIVTVGRRRIRSKSGIPLHIPWRT